MTIYGIKLSRIQLIALGILIAGLIVGLYLLTTHQIFKSKAAADTEIILKSVSVPGASCDPIEGQAMTCTTSEDSVQVNIPDLRGIQVPK